MSKYIEQEAVMRTARDGYHSDFGRSMADLTSLSEVLEDTPTADVVEVVRCKDCKYLRFDKDFMTGRYCSLRNVNGGLFCEDNDFCSYGERADV